MTYEQIDLSDYAENSTPQTTQKGQTSQMPQCPCYNQEAEICRTKLDENIIDELNILEIGCGHAIDYFAENLGATISQGTADSYRSYLRRYIESLHEQNMNACEAEFQDVLNYMKHLARINRSESTLSGYKSAITNLYKHITFYREAEPSVDFRRIREEINPANFQTPKPRERDYIEKNDLKKLFNNLGSFRNRLMAQVGAESGPRNIDICEIMLDAVDLDGQEINLQNTKTGGSYSVPISGELTILLRRWIRVDRKAMSGAKDSKYLFPGKGVDKLEPGTFCHIVKKAARKADIQQKEKSEAPLTEREKETLNTNKDYKHYHRVTPHNLRHTFYHLLKEAGVPKEARSEAMDHESVEVTDEFYDHEESDYAELIDSLFSGINIKLV